MFLSRYGSSSFDTRSLDLPVTSGGKEKQVFFTEIGPVYTRFSKVVALLYQSEVDQISSMLFTARILTVIVPSFADVRRSVARLSQSLKEKAMRGLPIRFDHMRIAALSSLMLARVTREFLTHIPSITGFDRSASYVVFASARDKRESFK